MAAKRRTRQHTEVAANSSDATGEDRTLRRSARRRSVTSTTIAAAVAASQPVPNGRAWSEAELSLLLEVASDAVSEPNATLTSMAAAYQRTTAELGLEARTHKSVVTRLTKLCRESPGSALVPPHLRKIWRRRERERERGRRANTTGRPAVSANPHAVLPDPSDPETDSDADVAHRGGGTKHDRGVAVKDERVGGQREPRVLDDETLGKIAAAATAAAVAAVFQYSRLDPARRPQS